MRSTSSFVTILYCIVMIMRARQFEFIPIIQTGSPEPASSEGTITHERSEQHHFTQTPNSGYTSLRRLKVVPAMKKDKMPMKPAPKKGMEIEVKPMSGDMGKREAAIRKTAEGNRKDIMPMRKKG
jgi:hypothetical protein